MLNIIFFYIKVRQFENACNTRELDTCLHKKSEAVVMIQIMLSALRISSIIFSVFEILSMERAKTGD